MKRLGVVGVGLGLVFLVVLRADAATLRWAHGLPTDLTTFVWSAHALAAGGDPYAPDPAVPWAGHVNLNPPAVFFALRPLADADAAALWPFWAAGTLACWAAAVALLGRRQGWSAPALAWVVAGSQIWETVELGQVYAPLALAAAGAVLLLGRGHRVAGGVLVGVVVAAKPNLAVWPVLLLVAGHAVVAGVAVATAAALWLGALAAFGPGVYAGWLAAVGDVGQSAFPANGSLPGVFVRAGLAPWGAVAAAALLVALAAWAWRRRPDAVAASRVALVGALLAAPIAWSGYGVLLAPLLVARRPSRWLVAAVVAFLVPSGPFDGALVSPVTVAYACALVGALAQARHIATTAKEAAPPPVGVRTTSASTTTALSTAAP